MKTVGAYLILTLLAQVTPDQLQKPFEVPMQQQQQQLQKPFEVPMQKPPIPENLKKWPKSCQRLHLESNKCENGLKSCNQHQVDLWRKRCEKDETKQGFE